MSNAIAQSTSQLVISSQEPESYDFDAAVKIEAARQVKNNTKESFNLNRQKLIASSCSAFRNHFPQLFQKRDDKGNIIPGVQKLTPEYFSKVEQAVDNLINSTLLKLNRDTMTSTIRNVHKAGISQYVQVRTVRDENSITWKEQLTSCHIDMRIQNRRLKDLEKAGKLTDDLELKIRKQLGKLGMTENNILTHLPEDERTVFTES